MRRLVVALVLTAAPAAADEPPIPELAAWEANMLSYGATYCAKLVAEHNLGDTYYDSTRVFYQIAEYTGDTATWYPCAEISRVIYLDEYLIPNNGAAPGYWTFTQGLRLDWEIDAHQASKDQVLLQGTRGYADSDMPEAWTDSAELSRETAYAINAIMNRQALGGSIDSTRLEELVVDALDHLDQWFVTRDYVTPANYAVPECRSKYDVVPFMVGLTVDALIRYWEVSADVRVQPKITAALDAMWDEAWVPASEAFWYENCKTLPGDAWPNPPLLDPAPDLNLLIAPGYAWLYQQTADTTYRDQADAIFAGGVRNSWLGGTKQWNQQYALAFDYVAIRQGSPVTIPHLRIPQIQAGDTYATVTFGVDMATGTGIDYGTDCTLTFKTSPGGATVDTLSSTEGLSVRSVTTTALSASTSYTVEQSCVGLTSDTNLYSFTTRAAPAGGDRTVPIQIAAAPTYSGIARATVQYDDNAALSTPTSVQNTDCAGACTINLTIPAGRYWYRVIRQTVGDVTVAVGGVQPLSIP